MVNLIATVNGVHIVWFANIYGFRQLDLYLTFSIKTLKFIARSVGVSTASPAQLACDTNAHREDEAILWAGSFSICARSTYELAALAAIVTFATLRWMPLQGGMPNELISTYFANISSIIGRPRRRWVLSTSSGSTLHKRIECIFGKMIPEHIALYLNGP